MNTYSQINSNKVKTFGLFAFFLLFSSFVIYLLGKSLGYTGPGLLLFAFLLSFASNFFSYYFSDKIVLTLHGAVEAKRSQFFDLYTVTENLALAAGLPKPRIFVMSDSAPNAFATGRNPKQAIVVVTTGLLNILDRRELEGVIAHELSHVKNYDMLLMTVASVMVGLIVYLTDFFQRALWLGRNSDEERNNSAVMMLVSLIVAILAPVIATLLQLAISRKREFLADASAAYLTRYPEGLARALEKISSEPQLMQTASNATADLFIANPFKADANKKNSWFVQLFSTHPPITERVARLRAM
jgi:heat shock protein HtpX